MHCSALFLCTSAFHYDNLYFFMLHFFHVPLFSCTFSILHHFHVVLFCIVIFPFSLFMLHFYKFKCFRFAFISCYTLCMLQLFHVALCPQISKMESFATIINSFVNYCCKALHLRYSRGSWFSLLFPRCTFLILKDMRNERKTENTTKKNDITFNPVNFFHFYFDIL